MLGCVPGRSIRDNASVHVGQDVLVTLDLMDCFPRISNDAVHRCFRGTLGFGRDVAAVLTKLTTFQTRLPQGAPTSPAIANLVLLPMHREIQGIAYELGLVCTSFVDDIALSGPRAREAIEKVFEVIQRHGFAVRQSKKRCMSASTNQALTGTVVNRKVSAGRKRFQALRQRIYELSTRPTQVGDAELRSIRGSIAHVRYLNQTQGAALERYADRVLPVAGSDIVTCRKAQSYRLCRCTDRHRRSLYPSR